VLEVTTSRSLGILSEGSRRDTRDLKIPPEKIKALDGVERTENVITLARERDWKISPPSRWTSHEITGDAV